MFLRSNTIRVAAILPIGAPLRKALLQVLAVDKVALRVREMERLLSMGHDFAVLTSYNGTRSKSDNKRRFSEFYRILQEMGYRHIDPLKGVWDGLTENSVVVPGMKFTDALYLGHLYEQDAVIYKHPSGVVGMYNMQSDTAVIYMQPNGDIAAQVETGTRLLSKSRGISFEFGMLSAQRFPWDGRGPITRDQVDAWIAAGMPA